MTRKINLGGQRARELIDRRQERARMDSGYTFTEYKSLARLSVSFKSGVESRFIRRTLPDIFEVTEIVYSGVEEVEDD